MTGRSPLDPTPPAQATVRAPRPDVRGPGPRSAADSAAQALTRGLEQAARSLALPASDNGATHVARLRVRVPARATDAEIARAFQAALGEALRRPGR